MSPKPGAGTFTPRILWLDVVRLISIVWICLFHVPKPPQNDWVRYLFRKGSLGVFVFLIVSVVSLALSEKSGRRRTYSSFLLTRLTRIAPVYYVALSFVVVARWGLWGKIPTWPDLLIHGLFLQDLFSSYSQSIIAPAWFLTSVWQIYLCFPLMSGSLDRFGLSKVLAACLLMSFAWRLLWRGIVNPGWFNPGGVIFHFLPLMALTLYLAKTRLRGEKLITGGLGAMAVVGVVFLVVMKFASGRPIADLVTSLGVARAAIPGVLSFFVIAVAAISLEHVGGPVVRGLAFLGKKSYAFFLLHGPFIGVAQWFFEQKLGWGVWWFIVVYVALLFAMSVLFEACVNRLFRIGFGLLTREVSSIPVSR
ncbi:acyltransferase family protein [Deferrisoma camini]|uniref:acyltransferase family protein n=1 Tax=Deferrisoma camini TaxID=1035120 RepID=UPI00146DE404|nr:acyltransferase [Deferrisoma camini]